MWLLRFGKGRNWRSAASAIKDLKPRPRDEGLSVFKVETREEALQVCAINALVFQRGGPDDRFFVLIPETCLEQLGLSATNKRYDNQPEFLNERHYEIPKASLDDNSVRRLAEQAFTMGVVRVEVSENEIRQIARDFANSPDIEPFVNEAWAAALLDDSDSDDPV